MSIFSEELGEGCSCIIVKKEPYSERAKKWIEKNNLKVGDYVKVLRKAESYENGWENIWAVSMDHYVGKTLKVCKIQPTGKIILNLGKHICEYPYFVLEKSEPPKPKYIPFESKEEFLERYTQVKKGVESGSFNDNLLQCGIWLRYKESGDLLMVRALSKESIYISMGAYKTFGELLDDFEFIDGSPCGKKVKDV